MSETSEGADFLLESRGVSRDLGARVVGLTFGRDGSCGFGLGDGMVHIARPGQPAEDWVAAAAHDGAVLSLVADAKDGFLTGGDGPNLLAGYKRAGNILKAEEKKGAMPAGPAVAMPGAPKEEGDLIAALAGAEAPVARALQDEDFAGAMRALSALRGPVDAFFEGVLVNSENAAERENRLRLLVQVRDLMERVADFSQVTG